MCLLICLRQVWPSRSARRGVEVRPPSPEFAPRRCGMPQNRRSNRRLGGLRGAAVVFKTSERPPAVRSAFRAPDVLANRSTVARECRGDGSYSNGDSSPPSKTSDGFFCVISFIGLVCKPFRNSRLDMVLKSIQENHSGNDILCIEKKENMRQRRIKVFRSRRFPSSWQGPSGPR